MKKIFFSPLLFLACLLVAQACAQDLTGALAEAQSRRLWENSQWRALGHYKQTWRGTRSGVDDPKFFLSPQGKRSPRAELEATIHAFSQVDASTDGDHQPACLYPARYAWITQELNWNPPRMPGGCPLLEDWLEKLDGQSLSLIFASAYLHSPATMYGHTFLRLDQNEEAKNSLLSYSINFAADTPETNGVLFAVRGLIGSYPGRFSTVPYYIKIQRYSNIENRDLWEYKLNFKPEEIRRMLLHLWEAGRAYSDYYFLTENCSYQLLPMLEAARPSLRLSSRFHFKAIPIDTIRAVTQEPGLSDRRRLRPSALSQMIACRAALNLEEAKAARAAAKNPSGIEAALASIPEKRRGPVMAAAYQLFRYSQGHARFLTKEQEEDERRILLAMSKLDIPDEKPVAQGKDSDAPELGHKTGRVAFLGGLREGHAVFDLSLRPALHDLLDPEEGYVPFTRLEMFHLKARYAENTQKFFIHKFDLVDLISLSPLDPWAAKPSWGVQFGLDSRADIEDQSWETSYFHANGKTGASVLFHPLGRKLLVYGLAQMDGGAGPAFGRGFRTGAGALPGFFLDAAPRLRLNAEASYRYYFFGEIGGRIGCKASSAFLLSRQSQIRFSFEQEDDIQEYLWGIFYTF